jgi:hypothetical protein
MNKIIHLIALITVLIFTTCTQKVSPPSTQPSSIFQGSPEPPRPLDMENEVDNLKAFVKARTSLVDSQEVIFYCKGLIYSYIPDERGKAIMGFEMYNIAKSIKTDEGYTMLTREMLVYTDPDSGKILTVWKNPWTKEAVEVIPVWNDPVNQRFPQKGWYIDYMMLGKDRICMNSDIFLYYPSPLKKAEFPDNSRSDMYQACELFNFFASKSELDDPKVQCANAEITWNRFSDFLPWMKMGSKPGQLCYVGRGYKITEGFKGLPKKLQDYVMANKPEYAHAPDKYTKPNMTSWKYFKELKSKKP